MKSLILFAAAATALTAAPVALADEKPQTVVEYSASDLTSAEGVAQLRADIHEAAEDVCIAPAQPTLSERRQRAECIDGAVAGAEAQLEDKIAALGVRHLAEAGRLEITGG